MQFLQIKRISQHYRNNLLVFRRKILCDAKPKPVSRNEIVVVWVNYQSGGEVNYQIQIVTKLPNENIQNYQLEMFDSRGGVNYQMQIVTKLPKSKYPKLPTRNVQFWGGGVVNYQMQIVTKLPNGKYLK